MMYDTPPNSRPRQKYVYLWAQPSTIKNTREKGALKSLLVLQTKTKHDSRIMKVIYRSPHESISPPTTQCVCYSIPVCCLGDRGRVHARQERLAIEHTATPEVALTLKGKRCALDMLWPSVAKPTD